MLASVLHSEVAINVSIGIMRAFVEMRRFIANNALLFERISNVELKQLEYQKKTDEKLEQIFEYISDHEESNQKIFFDGQIYDAFSLLIGLIQKAETEIVLVDGYVDVGTLNTLSTEAIVNGNRTALLAMATGTGKTRTVLGFIYKMLESKRFRRILFLVDRVSLGEQAMDTFKDVKLKDLMTLNEIYELKSIDDNEINLETKVSVSTVQGLLRRTILSETPDLMPGAFDLIIVDEAHRGYILDREMTQEEILYDNQDDYMSKYKQVIEYFDAVKVALTATPALHTTEIFGKPIFTYSYREAVIDGWLVDHDPPYIINTGFIENHVKFKKGETLAQYDPNTNELVNGAVLQDELDFDVSDFNRKIILPDHTRKVLEEISNYLNPESREKTLIFAVNDNHADCIVDTLRHIYEPYGISNDAIMKITGKTAGGNKKKILQVIKQFKNNQYPNIAVTVDLLTTGIDVPSICILLNWIMIIHAL